jgi:transposase-like protein
MAQNKIYSEISEATIIAAVHRLSQGEPLKKISSDIDVQVTKLSQEIKRLTGKSVVCLRGRRPLAPNQQAAFEMIQSGSTLQEAASRVGKSKQALSYLFKKLKIKTSHALKLEESESNVLKLIREGKLSLCEIVNETGRSSESIKMHIEKEGIVVPLKKRLRRIKLYFKDASEDMSRGMTYREVAKKYNVSLPTAHNWSIKAGITAKPKKPEDSSIVHSDSKKHQI